MIENSNSYIYFPSLCSPLTPFPTAPPRSFCSMFRKMWFHIEVGTKQNDCLSRDGGVSEYEYVK